MQGSPLMSKRLGLLQGAAPGLARVALLADASSDTAMVSGQAAVAAATALGLEVQQLNVRSPDDLVGAFELAVGLHADGLLYVESPPLFRHHGQVADLALKERLPSIGVFRGFPEVGGLMAYGTDLRALNRRAAVYVDKILKGAKPADLPVEQPMTFDFVVNMKTARELGITFPNEILLQVTEVIQ
jgi:putative ABC transport system substrate-binding protein